MFVCRGSPEYNWKALVAKLTPEAYAEWVAGCPSIREYTTDKTQEQVCKEYLGTNLVMDDDEIGYWNKIGVEVNIKQIRGLTGPGSRTPKELHQTIFQVAVSDVGLMEIREVDVLEDACTDDVRGYLMAGWRILAICPANGTRRPTYIIGHKNENERNARR